VSTPAELARLHAAAMTEPRPWSAEEFAALLALASTHVSACPRAFALGRIVAGEAELLTLATLPEARRQGLARRHLARFEAAACDRGAAAAFLEVAADNAPAVALYTATGWREVGRRAGYYRRTGGAGGEALVLRKDLDAAAAGPAGTRA
jgi:ribosomal-protein-alanine N-acetyltransferase